MSAPDDGARRRFAEWVKPEIPSMMVRLRRLGVREADVEDVVHDVVIRLWQHQASFDPSKPFGPWAAAFCVRAAANYRRLARNARQVPCEREPAAPTPDAEHLLADEQQRRLLAECLDQLDDEQREVLVLVDIEEMPVGVVADVLGINPNTASYRLRAARLELARLVRRATLVRGGR